MFLRCSWLALLFILTAENGLEAASFIKDVAPVFAERCLTCHGSSTPKGGYRMDTFDHLLRPGDSGKAPITSGSILKSHLYDLVTTKDDDDRMPQKANPLTKSELGMIRGWIEEGAFYDGGVKTNSWIEHLEIETMPTLEDTNQNPKLLLLPISALAWTSGGELLVGGRYLVTVMNSKGEVIRKIGGMPERIEGLEVQGDGNRFYFCGGSPGRRGYAGQASIREPSARPQILARASEMFYGLDLDPTGKWLAVGGGDKAVRIIALENRIVTESFEGHSDWLLDLAFDSRGDRLFTASRDGTARVLGITNSTQLLSYREHKTAVGAVAFDPLTGMVVSSGTDNKLHLWNSDNAKAVKEIDLPKSRIADLVVWNGQAYALSINGELHEFSIKDKIWVRKQMMAEQRGVTLAMTQITLGGMDYKWLAIGYQNGLVQIWRQTTARDPWDLVSEKSF